MEKAKNLSLRRHLASLAWAVYTALGTTFIMFFTDEVIRTLHLGDYVNYLLWGIIISICCFLILRYDPKSIWYVPLVSSSVFIPTSYIEMNFWGSLNSISLCLGVILIVAASFFAYRIGKKKEVHPPVQVKRA